MQKPLKKRHIFTIALPNYAQDLMRGPGEALIQGIYATYFGIDLAAIATMLLISKIFDAITDPIVGVSSDRHYNRTGTRKPWLIWGTLISMVGMGFLYNPSESVDSWYFITFYLTMYLGWTLAEIPYAAWKAEVSHNYETRTHIGMMDSIMGALGSVTFGVIPILMVAFGVSDVREHSPDSIHLTSIVVAIALPILVFITLISVPNGKPIANAHRPSLKEVWSAVSKSKPVLYLIAIYTFASFASMFKVSTEYLYVVRYANAMELYVDATLFATIVLLLSMPLASWICNRFGKHRAWALSIMVMVLMGVISDLVVDHSDPDNAYYRYMPLIYCAVALSTAMAAINVVALKALIGDLSDYGEWKFRSNLSGAFITAILLPAKFGGALGSFTALMLLSSFGFDADNSAEITRQGSWGLRLAYTWIPFVLSCLYLPFLLKYPFDRRRHAITIRALERRARREGSGLIDAKA